MLDKLAKKNIIHKKKASNLKSSLVKHVNSLIILISIDIQKAVPERYGLFCLYSTLMTLI